MFHVKQRRWPDYAAMLRKWNVAINLVSPTTLDQIRSRHIADSRALVDFAADAQGKWVDLGSGGGFPGMVVAICRPDLDVTLIESDQRKCSFLRSVSRELSLKNVSVIPKRIEAVDRLDAANVSARALASLPLLMSYVDRHLSPSGTAWLMKGRNWQDEVAEARREWSFDLKTHSSKTDSDAAILEITGLVMSETESLPSQTRKAALARPPPQSIWARPLPNRGAMSSLLTSTRKAMPRPGFGVPPEARKLTSYDLLAGEQDLAGIPAADRYRQSAHRAVEQRSVLGRFPVANRPGRTQLCAGNWRGRPASTIS